MGYGSMAKKKSKLTQYVILIVVMICMGLILLDLSTNIYNEVTRNRQVEGTSVLIQPTPTFEN